MENQLNLLVTTERMQSLLVSHIKNYQNTIIFSLYLMNKIISKTELLKKTINLTIGFNVIVLDEGEQFIPLTEKAIPELDISPEDYKNLLLDQIKSMQDLFNKYHNCIIYSEKAFEDNKEGIRIAEGTFNLIPEWDLKEHQITKKHLTLTKGGKSE